MISTVSKYRSNKFNLLYFIWNPLLPVLASDSNRIFTIEPEDCHLLGKVVPQWVLTNWKKVHCDHKQRWWYWIDNSIRLKYRLCKYDNFPSTLQGPQLSRSWFIGYNSRNDCARESVKTSSDSEDNNRSDEFEKKVHFPFEISEKNAIFWFSRSDFLEIFQKLPFTLPCEFFQNVFSLNYE